MSQEKLGETCLDGGKCHHQCEHKCFRRECCGPFSDASPEVKAQWEYRKEDPCPRCGGKHSELMACLPPSEAERVEAAIRAPKIKLSELSGKPGQDYVSLHVGWTPLDQIHFSLDKEQMRAFEALLADPKGKEALQKLLSSQSPWEGTKPPSKGSDDRIVSPWKPDDNPKQARRIGKCAEEVAELAKVLARISIQGMHAVNPTTGKTNIQELMEEMADVGAQFELMAEEFRLDVPFLRQRAERKKALMASWEAYFPEQQ